MTDQCSVLHNCLYFTANALARAITRMAEEEFALAGMSPSQAFVITLVNETPGIVQKDLAEKLSLAPSTVTRMVDALAGRGYLEKQAEGKLSKLYPTAKGKQLQEKIEVVWCALYNRYTQILGEEASHRLAQEMDQASQKLDKG